MTPRAIPRAVLVLVGAAAFVVAIAGLRAVAGIVAPVMLGLVITVTLHPLRGRLSRRMPGWAASIVLLLTAYVILLVLALSLLVSVGRLGKLIPRYSPEIEAHWSDLGRWLADRGVGREQADTVVSALNPDRLVSVLTTVLSETLTVASALILLVTILYFMAFDAAAMTRAVNNVAGERPHLASALHTFASGTRKYIGVSASFGFVVAVLDTVALWLMGVPGAFIWGVLSFVTNFIPNIGFVIGLIPPALIALLEGGPWLMLGVIIVYAAINFVLQSLVQPRIVGDVVGLTPTLTFLSLVFWSFVVGPLGALLAVPLTLLVKAVLVDADPQARWVGPFVSGKPTETPAQP